MLVSSDSDVIAMRIHLNELRSKFDQAMREGESFPTMKEIHLQIKELESCLQVLEWTGISSPSPRNLEEPASRTAGQRRYRHIEEPPPLL